MIGPDGRALLVERGSPPNQGRWSFPGGAVELGETCRECASRETLEETGLEIEVGPVVDVVDLLIPDAGGTLQYHYVVIDFLAHPVGGRLQPGGDVRAVRWATLDEAATLDLAPPTGEVLALAMKLKASTT